MTKKRKYSNRTLALWCSSELDSMGSEDPQLLPYYGCKLNFALYYQCSDKDTCTLCFDNRDVPAKNEERITKLIHINSLISKFRNNDLKKEQCREQLNELGIKVGDSEQPEITFYLNLTFEREVGTKGSFKESKVFSGRRIKANSEDILKQLNTWLKLDNKDCHMSIGLNVIPLKDDKICCNYCGKPMHVHGYYVRTLTNLVRPDVLNLGSDETVTIKIRLKRYICDNESSQEGSTAAQCKCPGCSVRGQKKITHVAAPHGLIVPFLRYKAVLISDVVKAMTSPKSRDRILHKEIYSSNQSSFINCLQTHGKTWLKHFNYVIEKLKGRHLTGVIANHHYDKLKKHGLPLDHDAARRPIREEKLFALSFVRAYCVLLSEPVLRETTYCFYPPKLRPRKLDPG